MWCEATAFYIFQVRELQLDTTPTPPKKKPITNQLHSQTDGANVFSPCRVAGVSTCGTLFTPVPGCSGYGAHTVAALASPSAAAESAIL